MSSQKETIDWLIGFGLGLFLGAATVDCRAGDWSTTDKVLFGTYIAASAIDAAQTSWAMDQRHPNGQRKYREVNPLLGDNPSDGRLIATKAAFAGVLYLVADRFPRARNTILWTATAVQVGIIAHNFSIGLKVNF